MLKTLNSRLSFHCQLALTELRRSRWLSDQSQQQRLPNCFRACTRLLKDLSTRDPAWSRLTDWDVVVLALTGLREDEDTPLAEGVRKVMEVKK